MSPRRKQLSQLVVLNLSLQAFDAVATYQGLRLGWKEANPILAAAFAALGIGPALLCFKVKACLLLVVLYRLGSHPAVPAVLGLLAGAYILFSFIPWMAKFATLLF